MQTELIIAGFGGQGVLFAGQLLAYAALGSGKEVTWIPSYGPEMRGGTANCTVTISDEEIGSPVVRNPQAAIVLNLPSLDKYEPLVKPGGVLIINTSMIPRMATRTDLKVVHIPASEIAETIGDKRMTNMVLLGSLLANLPVLTFAAVEKALAEHTPDRHKRFLPLNIQALKQGAAYLAQPVK
ncbi:MAG: 2-oxoacid:acceptor oxidoreductase family protein [Anaerolineaceae bacterium]|nr:2-oxoacid:acceptor oxidoreductase family protein [Anaerolineaceae bacterium]